MTLWLKLMQRLLEDIIHCKHKDNECFDVEELIKETNFLIVESRSILQLTNIMIAQIERSIDENAIDTL